MKAGRSWFNIPESGTLVGMRLMVAVYRFGGGWLFRVCLFPVVLFYFVTRPEARHASRDYLRRLSLWDPAFPRPAPWHSFRHLWQFALALMDKLSVWMGHIGIKDVVVHNGELIDDLIDRGRGAVLLISHLGNFEICSALSETRPGMRLTVLHHTRHAARFNRLLSRYSAGSRIKLRQVTEMDVGMAIDMSARIADGEFIAIAADRVPVNNPDAVRRVDFLGFPAPFPAGPFQLAMALEAPVIGLHCIKESGRYHIYFDLLGEGESGGRRQREERLRRLMTEYVRRLETFCRRAPWQWYNFYPFWGDTRNIRKQDAGAL